MFADVKTIYHSTPETREYSKQWVFRNEPTPEKARATVSSDARSIILIDYLEKYKTINGMNVNLRDNSNYGVKKNFSIWQRKKSSYHRIMTSCTLASQPGKIPSVSLRIVCSSTKFARFFGQRLFPFSEYVKITQRKKKALSYLFQMVIMLKKQIMCKNVFVFSKSGTYHAALVTRVLYNSNSWTSNQTL